MLSPAPWSVSDKGIYIRDKDGQQVCLLGAFATVEDANLIAAAPDLLAALFNFINSDEEHEDRHRIGRAAVNKAIGRES